jgi:hypothetical protein
MFILNMVKGTYGKFPARLPQGFDRPLVRVDSVEFRAEDPVSHDEYCKISNID